MKKEIVTPVERGPHAGDKYLYEGSVWFCVSRTIHDQEAHCLLTQQESPCDACPYNASLPYCTDCPPAYTRPR